MADEEDGGGNGKAVAPIIIKKINKIEGGHHGGAWKVAYADFVTAMMAFFMLLWLLNVSDSETLAGLAEYFAPSTASTSGESGAGGILSGQALASDGTAGAGKVSLDIDATPAAAQQVNEATDGPQDGGFNSNLSAYEKQMFEETSARLRQAIQESPDLNEHNDQIFIDQTEDGLRIQVIDKDARPMFRLGSAELYGYAVRLIEEVGDVVATIPNRVSIVGHTDAKPRTDASYSNWELSSDRANAARRVLRASGVSGDRVAEVIGKAAGDPLYADEPYRSENRRIEVTILREAPVVPPAASLN